MSSISNPKSNVKLLTQLLDVNVASPADSNILVYDYANSKWKNTSKANLTELTASNANITILTASKANITSELTASKANITSLTSSNANIASLTSTTISATSITASFNGNGSSITNITASNIPLFSQDVRGQLSGGTGIAYNPSTGVISSNAISSVSSTGNITGSGVAGNELRLKDSITLIGDVTASNGVFSNNIYVAGTASIGMLNTVQQQNLQVGDKYITIMSGANNHTALDGAGILLGSGSTDGTTGDQQSVAYVLYRGIGTNTDYMEIFPGLNVIGQLTASNAITSSVGFYGNGANLINLNASNITNFTTNVQSQIIGSTNITVSAGTASLNSSITLDTINANSITSSFNGNGSQLSNLTASNINNFTSDVRTQLTGGTGIIYDPVTGIITATGGGGGSSISTGTSTSLTASSESFILCSGSVTGSVIDVRLPLISSIGNGKNYIIKNSGVGVVNVLPTSTDKIDGATSASLYTSYSSYSVFGSASNWWIY